MVMVAKAWWGWCRWGAQAIERAWPAGCCEQLWVAAQGKSIGLEAAQCGGLVSRMSLCTCPVLRYGLDMREL